LALPRINSAGNRRREEFLFVIDVVEEQIQRRHPLHYATFDVLPFIRTQDARDRVERQDAVDRIAIRINRKGDAQIVEGLFGVSRASGQIEDRRRGEPFANPGIGGTVQQLAIETLRVVILQNEFRHAQL
jgi:hypothetical protein